MTDGTDDALTAMLHEMMPLTALLGFEGIESGQGRVVVRGEWAAERCTAGGSLHGAFLMALADSAAATCAFLNLPDGAVTTTIEAKTNFLRAVSGGAVLATATPVHVGRTTIVLQTDVTRHDGKLVTRTTQTQAVIGP
jgi:uncharacterized protein (TIGR00369 family)